jgi:predicted DNA binding CopG/RHH family protein
MPSQQLELKSDITNLFKDLESIAKDTKVNAPHVPKIEQADITELFSGLNEAHEEAKIEVELRLSLEEKNELDIITNLADTFSEITKPEENPKPVDESVNLQALEEIFSTITEPNSEDIVVDEIKVDTISEEPTSVEKTASMIDKAIVHLDSLEGKTEITEEVNQIATLRKEFDNFRSLIAQQIASTQMSGAGGGEVRLEFMDDVDRDSVKVDGKFLKYQASTNKFVGADAGDTITNEQLQDVVGAMISSNTESGITVTYEDSDGTLDFVVGTLNQDTTGNAATATTLETARTIHGVSFDGSANIDLSEVIQDTVGAMFSSNTETDIAVTYQDSDGTIDLVVSGISGNAGTATALETARTIAGVSFDGTANITIASTDLSNTSDITLLTSTQTLTNKTLTSPVINTGLSGTAFLDEDDMSSNSATKVASQQSIKAFVDAVESRTRAFAIAIGAGL